jgi:FkbM family methyltransferase
MMDVNLHTAWRLLRANPSFFVRKASKKLLVESSRLMGKPWGTVLKRCNGVQFECSLDADATIREMWFGAYELDETELLRRFLKPGDVFVDVGANIGYFSFVAASCVGSAGQIHLATLNPDYRFILNQCALGEADGTATVQVTSIQNIGWSTMVPNFMPPERVAYQVEVPVRRLDDYIAQQQLERIAMIKIDVEGFEYPVLKGLGSYLAQAEPGTKPLLLVEVCPAAHRLLGHSVHELFAYLARFMYCGYRTWNLRKPVGSAELSRGITNVLFMSS